MILCLLMVFAAVVQAAPAGKVTNLEGRADLTVTGQPAKALFIGDTVNVGDILRTKSGSKLEVTWIDGSIARLSENSRLKVTEFTLGAQKRSTILSLFRGKVQNIVTGTTKLFGAKDGSRYEVHTPTSVCGVRGTIFFTYHENGISGALFTEGKGFMYSKGQPSNVKPVAPGVLMIVTSANKPPEAKPAKPGDATKLFNATNPSEKKKDDKKGEDKKEGAAGEGTSKSDSGTTASSGKDESKGGTKTEDTGSTTTSTSTTTTSGTTGTGDTASGTTGTGGTTTMLGGDPTATLGTAAPGTLAAKIEAGTVADTPGTSSPLTNPTNPVTPVVVPVIEPTQTETFTKLTQDVAQGTIAGTLTGSISDTTNTGTINLAGTGMESIYVVPTTGTLSDDSTDDAYLAGIPGSWRGLFTGLSRKGTTVSLLSGNLSGAYAEDQTLSASGSIARSTGYGISAESQYQSFTNLPLLVLQNLAIGQAFSDPVIYGPASGDITTDGIMGYNTLAKGILGIWGAKTLNGTYVNATGETSKTVNLYHYNYYLEYQDPSDHFAFGNAAITDDLKGHTTVQGSALTYLDRYYLGTLSLDYRGVYDFLPETSPQPGVSYPYSSIGTGTYNLQPLAWSGDWGPNRGWWYYGVESLYQNAYYPEDEYSSMELVAHEMGLVGGTTPFWTGTSRLTALGYLTDDSGTPVSGETVAGPLLWNSGIGAQALTGSTVEEVFTPDAEFTGVTAGVWKDGLMNGSAYAIYKTAAGQAGWLIGAIGGTYDSEIGMWKAEGDLTPTQRIAQLPEGVTADDLEVFHDIGLGILGGSFTGNQGKINNYESIMQTTFYGKQISVYDEEYEEYVDKILPMRWGIYDLRMAYGNSFSGKPSGAASWTSKVGGYGPTQMNAPFFYLADITGTWKSDGTIDGQLSGTYMTPLYLGVLSGPFYGLYTEEVTGSGGWIGQSVGTYNVTQKLAHSATWGENLYVWYSGEGGLFTDAAGELDHTGYVMGLLGGTTAPWSGSSALKAMGLFQVYAENNAGRGTYLWSDAIQGSVPREFTETPSAGGIYTGYSAALWRKDSYAGAIRTIYLTPPDATTGKSAAGFLAGDNIAGTIYNLVQDTYEGVDYVETYTVGAWESTGTNNLTASAPLASGLDPATITSSYGYIDGKISGSFAGTGALTNDTYSGNLLFFMNGSTPLPFGVYDLKLGGDPGGTFSGKPSGTTSWNAKLGGGLSIGDGGYNYEYGYWLADVGGQWSADGEITGNVANGKYLTTMQSGTLSGPFYGLYTEGETAGAGTWVGQSVGNYEGQSLAFSASIDWGSCGYFDLNTKQMIYGDPSGTYLKGIIGSATSFIGASALLSGIGTYYAASVYPLYEINISKNLNVPNKADSLNLWFGGVKNSTSLSGRMMGLYANFNGTNYDVGFLSTGDVTGNFYSGIGMWELTSGAMTSSSKGTLDTQSDITPNITVTDTPRIGSISGNGGIKGVSNGYDMYFTQADGTWGVWRAETGGTYTSDPTSGWTGVEGTVEMVNNAIQSYSISHLTGKDWTDGQLAATTSGRFLSLEGTGRSSGDILGVYDSSSKTWQALGIGQMERTEALAFSSVLTGNLYQVVPGTVYNKEYKQPLWNSSGSSSWFNPLRYEINYFAPADVTTYPYDVRRTIAFESYRIINGGNIEYHYFPNGKYVPVMKGMGVTFETESIDTPSTTDFSSNPPVTPISGSVNIVDNTPGSATLIDGVVVVTPGTVSSLTSAQHVKSFYSEWPSTNALVQNGAFTGILGGLNNVSLWNSSSENKTNLILMGNHNAYNGSQIFGTSMGGIIGTGGYLGVLTGIIQDTDATTAYSENPLEGLIVGLYVDPNGNAGVLKGNFTGASYTGSVNMWESTDALGSATLYRYSTNAYSLSPSALSAYFRGNIGAGINSAMHGTFGGSGWIDTPMGLMGQTFSIGSTPCWGIFSMQIGLANTFSKPAGSSDAWTAALLGSGEFGNYPTYSSGTYRDLGYWSANITAGTWTGGKLTGILAGDFLTHKKIGTLEGSLLGTYDGTTSGIWQAAAAGTYVKTRDVLFSSEIWGNHYALATAKTGGKSDYGDGSSYFYWYNNDPESLNNYGDSTYDNKTARTKTITRFDIQGPPGAEKAHKDVWVYNTVDDSYTFTTIVYDSLEAYNTDMASLQKDPVSQNPLPSTDQMNFRESDFNGILAGVDNLWANIGAATPTAESPYTSSPTRIYMMGDINKFDKIEPRLFTGTVVSFDPLAGLNPFMNSKSPVIDGKYGAYYGFLGGTAAPDNTLSGFFRAFYMDQNRKIGLIYTDAPLAGSFDATTGMWKAEGNVYTYKLLNASNITDSSVMPESFAYKLQSGWGQSWENNMSFSPIWEDGHVSGGTGINFAAIYEAGVGFPFVYPLGEQVMSSYLSLGTGTIGGKFSGSNLPTNWTWTFTPYTNDHTSFISVTDLTITESNHTFKGNTVNADVNWENGSTSITGGEIKGLFDPVASTWQAVRNGTSLETAAFVNLVNSFSTDAEKNAFMTAMKIPAVLVGTTDLRGSGSVTGGSINLGSASDAGRGILNTGFYAYSTGAKPQVWASGSVNGAYTGSPTAGTVNLSGYAPGTTGTTNGITANFNVQQFGASTWGATVTNGNAPANSLTAPQGGSATHAAMTFQGGAAGTVNPTAGTFTGTAAGIVK